MEPNRRRLVVFWEGTGNTLDPISTQIGLFFKACQAVKVETVLDVPSTPVREPLKIGFDGCGVTHGNWGVLFASGLDEQCQLVFQIAEKMLEQEQKSAVHVVALGLSRGGVACMKLMRLLSVLSPEKVTCSTLLFDPVPGNAVSTGFPWTACYAYDLSQCPNLKRVLALYPYEALPDIAMHAPTLCRYNRQTTLVQEDVTMGCHQGAVLMPANAPPGQFPDLALRRILDFLECEGVKCTLPIRVPTPLEVVELMEYLRKRPPRRESVRKTHDERRRKILRHPPHRQGKRWLNRHHQQLVSELHKGNPSSSLNAVYGCSTKPEDTGCYQLDFDEGAILCPSPFPIR